MGTADHPQETADEMLPAVGIIGIKHTPQRAFCHHEGPIIAKIKLLLIFLERETAVTKKLKGRNTHLVGDVSFLVMAC